MSDGNANTANSEVSEIIRNVYSSFLSEVVVPHVFSDSERSMENQPLSDKQEAAVKAGVWQDTRSPYLCRTSAKGGWTDDQDLNEKYRRFRNVSMLDHLTSVVRGAITFAAIDLSESGITNELLAQRISLVAAIAFSHDIDKVLKIKRSQHIEVQDVEDFITRYGIARFLSKFGVSVSAQQLLVLIDQCENSRAGNIRPDNDIPDRNALNDCRYVQIADQMDSAFLDSSRGIEDAISLLQNFDGFRTSALKNEWHVININEPNCPFLLDTLLRHLSNGCSNRNGIPPLIEVHYDGCLTCIVPKDGASELIDRALNDTVSMFSGRMRVGVTAKGSIDILDSGGNLEDLDQAIKRMSEKERLKILQVRKIFKDECGDEIDKLLHSFEILPKWPNKMLGQLIPMWSEETDDEEYPEFQSFACKIAVTLCCRASEKSSKELSGEYRETELARLLNEFGILEENLPNWLSEAKDSDRRVVLAFLAGAAATNNDELENKLFGQDGLCRKWLEGNSEFAGLASTIGSGGDNNSQIVVKHFKSLLSGETIVAEDENAEGRCHFTNAPIAKNGGISLKDGFYALKVSAFSGREGRPEFVNRPKSETLLSPVSYAEYKLRQIVFVQKSEKRDIPVLISSPTTAGLFGALALDGDGNDVTLYDMLRADQKKGTTFDDEDGIRKRIYFGRYESYPHSIVGSGKGEIGQIGFIRGIMKASLRLGRAIHVFRGMQTPSLGFVYFDTLPHFLEAMLNKSDENKGCSLRIEQISDAIFYLEGIESIATKHGFGLNLATAVSFPDSRFSALCDAWSRADRSAEKDHHISRIEKFTTKALKGGCEIMKESESNIVAFAEAVAQYQKKPNKSDGAGKAEKAFRIALEQCEILETSKLDSEEDLVAAVAGSIQADFERGDLTFRKGGEKYLQELAEIFVKKVWQGAFNSTSPPSRIRRSSLAIYRWSFIRACTERIENSVNENPTNE